MTQCISTARKRVAKLLFAAAALSLAACATGAPTVAPIPTAQAIADPRRPAEDVALDTQRQGAAVLDLANIQPGWKVADIMQGAGYFTRLFVPKTGPTGKVYAWSPDAFMKAKPALYDDSLNVLQRAYPDQIVTMRSSFDDLAFPEKLDMVFTSQNYHDLHMKVFPTGLAAEMNKKVFDALKPGGIYVVVDHVANPDTANAPDTVHRIDPAVLRREIEAVGFKFDGESPALRKPADDHTLMVMNPAIRGKTDQIIYKFRKPG
ncbi:MAG: methyltransferase [Hyphomonadaceae bacterium]